MKKVNMQLGESEGDIGIQAGVSLFIFFQSNHKCSWKKNPRQKGGRAGSRLILKPENEHKYVAGHLQEFVFHVKKHSYQFCTSYIIIKGRHCLLLQVKCKMKS